MIVLAQEEAKALRHRYTGTEHLLLGLCLVQDGIATPALEDLDVTVDRVFANVVRVVGSGGAVTLGEFFPFTPRAKRVMERAHREALSVGHDFIGPEHLLLALLRDDDGMAVRILRELAADPEMIRRRMRRDAGRAATSSVVAAAPVTRVVKVIATVHLEAAGPASLAEQRFRTRRVTPRPLSLLVSLSAMLDTGGRIDRKWDFEMDRPCEGLQDIEREINLMLGRHPSVNRILGRDLHRAPLGAWDQLIASLAAERIQVDENELIEAPLTVELDAEVAAALQAE